MLGNVYMLRLVPTAITTALTIMQLKADAAAPIDILEAKLYQVTKTSTELLRVGLVRKTAAATVTTAVAGTHIFKMNPNDGTVLADLGTTSTGVTATGEGTDGEIPEEDVWNVANGSWQYLPIPEARIRVPAAGFLGLKVFTAPAASMVVGGYIRFMELA